MKKPELISHIVVWSIFMYINGYLQNISKYSNNTVYDNIVIFIVSVSFGIIMGCISYYLLNLVHDIYIGLVFKETENTWNQN